MSGNLYASYNLKRVYYSAFSPIPDASSLLQPKAPPLLREHRLYQADWLYRYYGFTMNELANATADGMLDARLDPKSAWAVSNRDVFPVDVNTAVPGEEPETARLMFVGEQPGDQEDLTGHPLSAPPVSCSPKRWSALTSTAALAISQTP